MKLSAKYIKILIPVGVLLIASGAFATIPGFREWFGPRLPKKEKRIVISENDKQQKAIISELTKLLHAMDTVTYITIAGTMDAQDLGDESNNIQGDFCYTRQGNQGYYQFGDNEMVSLTDAYIVVAHDMKKIYVSEPKEVVNPVRMSADMEATFLSRETYNVTRTADGPLTQISLVNNRHASCREYRVSFDSAGVIRRAVMRMSNPMEMEDLSKDRLLKVTVRSFEPGEVRQDLLRMERYVTMNNGELAPSRRLKGYELIKD
ncbi:hypothetical protein [Chitinophaga sp. CF418]|uniref:hypothetical protein n=1 Tax=Chitinophaga sp. CF418 TaxID=1855287 RepID=UPI00091FC966|nr:hypothetical protein [Chitinophaga sp. CF418]SHN29641.1 hypothetical protein SAMN05216311_108231 [Chitinophaga sp. CF418]